MSPASEADISGQVIPFPEREMLVDASTAPDWDALKQELVAATRDAWATAEEDLVDAYDLQVVADEHAFRARFGFERPRLDRKHLIELKHALDLTDREIRLLQRAGALSFKPGGVRLSASRWVAVYGRVMIATLGLLGLQTCHLASRQNAVTFSLVAKLVGLAVAFAGMGWFIQSIYIRPWLIQKRTQMYQRK